MADVDMIEAKIPTTEKNIIAALGLRPCEEDAAVADIIDTISIAARSHETSDNISNSPVVKASIQKILDWSGPHIWGQEEREHLVEAGSNAFYPKDLFYDDPSDYDTITYLLTLLLRKQWQKLREDSALAKLSSGFTSKRPGFSPAYTVTCFCSPDHDSHLKSPLLSDAWAGRLDGSTTRGLKPDGNASVDGKETFNEVLTLYLSQTDDFTKTYGPRTLKPKSARTDERAGYCAACYKVEKEDEKLFFKQISFNLTDKIWIYPFERNGELLFHILGSGNKSHFGEYRFWLGPGKGYIEDRFILVPPQRQQKPLKEGSQASYRPDGPEDFTTATPHNHQRNTSTQNGRQSNLNRFSAVNASEPSRAMSITPTSTPRDELGEATLLQSSLAAGEKRKFSLALGSRGENLYPPSKTRRSSHDSMAVGASPSPPPPRSATSLIVPRPANRSAQPREGIQIILELSVEGATTVSHIDITRCTGVDELFSQISEELEDEIPAGGMVKSVSVTFGWDQKAIRIRRGNSVSFTQMMRTVWEAPNEYWTEGRECKIMGTAKI